jgi:lipopolysaccharide export system protein LptC
LALKLIPSFLRDRGLPVAIGVIALAAGLAQALYWWLEPQPGNNDFVGPPRSGYVLHDFTMRTFDVDGLPGLQVSAPHLERREGDESLYINAPVFDLPSNQPGIPDWKGNSLYGWVNAAGTLLKLQGPVYMHRDAYADTAEAQLHTSEVTAWPKENRMETAEPAHMVQGDTTMSGIGMRANLNDNHLEMLHDFHGTFPPRQRTAPAAPAGRPAGKPAAVRPAASAGKAG